MAQDWDIKSRSDKCSACEKLFEDKEKYSATLIHNEEGYVRADYCLDCWEEKKKEDTSAYSIWQGVFKMPPPPEEEALQKETAESLLRKLMEDDDDSKVNVMYILAVMLERKKIFIERDVQIREDGLKLRYYEHKQSGETFVIPDPNLRLDELETVQEEVVVMLGGTVPKGKGSNAVQPEDEQEPEADEDEYDDDDDEYED